MTPPIIAYSQPISININNATVFDHATYIYMYPEFSFWAFKPDGVTIDTVAVDSIYTAFSSTNPYISFTTTGFNMQVFNWKMYWMVYKDNIILASNGSVAFPLAQPGFTVTHNGTTITNTGTCMLNYLIENQRDRLCMIHYARVGFTTGFNTNDIRDNYANYLIQKNQH